MTSMLSKVNLLQGTDSVHDFSTGNTLPLVARPWGMHHWSLQSGATPWVFNRRQRRLQGVRLTHQPSPWMQDYASMTVLPFTGKALDNAEQQASAYRQQDAVLCPNYMRTRLLRYGVDLEMAPTERGALFVFEFDPADDPKVGFYFDGEHVIESRSADSVGGFSGYSKEPVPEGFGLYFYGEFSVEPVGVTKTAWGGYAEFPSGTQRIEFRLSGSFIDEAQAQRALERELTGRDIGQLSQEGEQVWNSLLGRIEITPESEEQERLFYSCLYRCLLFPRFLDEVGAEGEALHRSPYDGNIYSGSLCADSGFWDVYRTLYPLLLIAYPDILKRIMGGWMSACREAGWAPRWPSPGPRVCMIGTHFDVLVADLVAKGMTDWDVAGAYYYMWKNATIPSGEDDLGRMGLADYLKLGYVPADRYPHAAACTLDYAYNDFCVAQVARYLGRESEAKDLLKRADNYRNVFDAKVGFMRGRLADGSWLEPFREYEWGGAFIEGSTWQHTLNVPHDPDGLATILGGANQLCAWLDRMMSGEPRYEAGDYNYEIHEASEMAASDFGQYAHSNQPVHGFLFLYALMGHSEKTSSWIHRVCHELYTVNDFPGDEDNGEMSAWYIWACMGLYPQCPGTSRYVCFEPLLEQVKIHPPESDRPLLFGRKHARGGITVEHGELFA